MEPVLALHVVAAGALVVAAASSAVWGLGRSGRVRLGGSTREDRGFTQLVALTQTLVVGAGLLGVLALAGPSAGPDDPLHSRVYGPFMVLAVIGSFSFRTEDPRWNVRVAAVVGIFITGLGVRAFFTG